MARHRTAGIKRLLKWTGGSRSALGLGENRGLSLFPRFTQRSRRNSQPIQNPLFMPKVGVELERRKIVGLEKVVGGDAGDELTGTGEELPLLICDQLVEELTALFSRGLQVLPATAPTEHRALRAGASNA